MKPGARHEGPGPEPGDADEVPLERYEPEAASGTPRRLPRVPGYRLEGILGRGATGIVYRARQLSVDRPVALKILNPELTRGDPGADDASSGSGSGSGRPRAARRLEREARTAARLTHPNVISGIDMGEVDGTWWYAMELVEGESLAERLRRGSLSEREALRLFVPLCEALAHLAEHGVVHRDIKPSNILLDRHGRARLVDLGLAFADDDPSLTQPGGTLGTPHYISPEQARDPSRVDAASDIWSFGATLFHAVCGRPPFTGRSAAEILTQVLHARVPDPHSLAPNLSRGLGLVLRKCLQRDRAVRYSDPVELVADLELVLDRRAPLVTRRGLEPVARKDTAWKPWAAAVAIALVAATAAFFALRPEPELSDTGSAKAPPEWPELEELRQRAKEDPSQLAASIEDLGAKARALPAAAAQQSKTVYDDLYGALEREVTHLQRDLDNELKDLLERRAFEEADSLVDTGVRDRLVAATGYVPGRLPGSSGNRFDAWLFGLRKRANASVRKAELELQAALDAELERLLARIDRLEAEHRWVEAAALLPLDGERWLASSGADARGLGADLIDDRVQRLLGRVRERRAGLDRAWREQDRQLLGWVQARAEELERDLDEGALVDAEKVLEREWNARLARTGIDVRQMPDNVRLALETYERSVTRLERRGSELRLKRADDAWRALELEIEPLWKERRYRAAGEVLSGRVDDARLAPLRDELLLRVREAETLADVLRRAAVELVRRDGQTIELRVGKVGALTGRLAVVGDPLERGFTLRLGEAGELPFVLLQGTGTPKATLLAPEALEELADLPLNPGSGGRAEERLTRALFRLREGDAEEARRVLTGEPMPPDDPLVEDLRRRIDATLSERISTARDRTAEAHRTLNSLRADRRYGDPHQRARVEELLRDYADVLTALELAEVRALKRELADDGPASLEELAALFAPQVGPEAVGSVGLRVRMGFRFDGASAGAWEPGTWAPDGRGWTRGATARSDADLVESPSPRLVLREPLATEDGLDVELVIEEPDDVDPELIVISAADFHVALHTPRGGGSARCHVGKDGVADAVHAVRAGSGRAFAGFERGRTYTLALKLNPQRGSAKVLLDGDEIASALLPVRRGDAETARLIVRAYEPLRLVRATIEASRR